jgi:hypothetical protein
LTNMNFNIPGVKLSKIQNHYELVPFRLSAGFLELVPFRLSTGFLELGHMDL